MTTPQPPTLDELRDWHAKRAGWVSEPHWLADEDDETLSWWKYTISKQHGGRTYHRDHPFPSTLDGAASAMPEGWLVTCTKNNWSAWSFRHGPVDVLRTADEKYDRYLLAKLARKKEVGE